MVRVNEQPWQYKRYIDAHYYIALNLLRIQNFIGVHSVFNNTVPLTMGVRHETLRLPRLSLSP